MWFSFFPKIYFHVSTVGFFSSLSFVHHADSLSVISTSGFRPVFLSLQTHQPRGFNWGYSVAQIDGRGSSGL